MFKLMAMKKITTISIILILWTAISTAQDDFEGSLDGWEVGGPAQSQLINPSGGPTGDYLEYSTTGAAGGAGSRMIIFNKEQWATDLTVFMEISFDASVIGNDLDFRIAVMGAENTRISTTNAVTVVDGSGWSTVNIPISETDFSVISGTNSINEVLQQAEEMRILSSNAPAYIGDIMSGTMQLDNVTGNSTLNLESFDSIPVFRIRQNPSQYELNIISSSFGQDTYVAIYDLLGKEMIRSPLIHSDTSIDVKYWSKGVYLVKVWNETAQETKRFIKY